LEADHLNPLIDVHILVLIAYDYVTINRSKEVTASDDPIHHLKGDIFNLMTYSNFTTEELENEEWKTIPQCPFYAASNLGRIKRIQQGAGARVNHIKQFHRNRNGYMYVGLCHNGIQTQHLVHRLILITFCGEPQSHQTDVNHIDNDRTNNRVSNLEFCTRKENLDWADAQVRLPRWGEKNSTSRLKNADIPIIRQMISDGVSDSKIGQLFNVHRRTICSIRLRENWKHIE